MITIIVFVLAVMIATCVVIIYDNQIPEYGPIPGGVLNLIFGTLVVTVLIGAATFVVWFINRNSPPPPFGTHEYLLHVFAGLVTTAIAGGCVVIVGGVAFSKSIAPHGRNKTEILVGGWICLHGMAGMVLGLAGAWCNFQPPPIAVMGGLGDVLVSLAWLFVKAVFAEVLLYCLLEGICRCVQARSLCL